MKLIFLIFTTVFCAIQLDTTQENFFIVTDREIGGLLKKDGMDTDLLTLEGSTCTLSPNFFWDKYFPKLLIYEFNCENLIKSNMPISLDLVGVTNDGDNDVLFGFTLSYDLESMKLFNFVDSSNAVINNAVYIEEDGTENIFLSREAKNVENISASYKYIRYTEKIEPLYEEIFEYLFKYIRKTKNLALSVKDDEKMFQQASLAEQSLILKTIAIIKSLSKLRMPSYLNLDDLHRKNNFKRAFVYIFKLLIKVVEVYFKKTYKDDEDIVWGREDVINHIRYEIVNNTLSSCDSAYKNLFKNLEGIVDFVKNAIRQINGNEDLEILSDCDSVKADEFIKKYSSHILNYCTTMQNSNNSDVFNHYFLLKKPENDSTVETLVEFYADKEFACTLSGFVNSYNEGDKTDFLIFSQTEYFMFTLPSRILNNIELLKAISVPLTVSETAQKDLNIPDLQEENEKYDFLIEIEKIWTSILKDNDSGEIKTFANFLN